MVSESSLLVKHRIFCGSFLHLTPQDFESPTKWPSTENTKGRFPPVPRSYS